MKRARTDQQKLLALLDSWGVQHNLYIDPQFLTEEALKAGATHCFGVRNSAVDFYFDAKGRFVGTATIYANSWCLRAKRERGK